MELSRRASTLLNALHITKGWNQQPVRLSGISTPSVGHCYIHKCPLNHVQYAALYKLEQPSICPYESIPRKTGLPVIGNLLDYTHNYTLNFNGIFKVFHERSEKYGEIFKETLGPQEIVTVTNPEEFLNIIRADGRYPHRPVLDPLDYYHRKNNLEAGLFNSQGETWFKHRKHLAKTMLMPKVVSQYIPGKNLVANDFVEKLAGLAAGPDGEIKDIKQELFLWAIETSGILIFNERLGCLKPNPPEDVVYFVKSLQGFLNHLSHFLFSVPFYKIFPTKRWQEFESINDQMLAIGSALLEKKLKVAQEGIMVNSGTVKEQDVKKDLLTPLILNKFFTLKESNILVTELMMASVESMSTSISWTLYFLGKHPDVQQAAYREVQSVVGDSDCITAQMLQQLMLVKSCYKEALRLYPVAFFISRILQKDINIAGYHIPTGTQVQVNNYSLSRDKALFSDPEKYDPYRWQRKEPGCRYSYNLNFGVGPRMCLGRRVAEVDICLSLTKILQKFRVEYHHEDVKPIATIVLAQDRPIRLKLVPRKSH
ncbi:hypothetical protein Ahia01_000424900 [Argonauta hians]